MTTQRQAMTAALEALEYAQQDRECPSTTRQAINAIRAALAETAEPVAGWRLVPVKPTRGQIMAAYKGPLGAGEYTITGETEAWLIEMYQTMLDTAPQPSAVELTDEEIDALSWMLEAGKEYFARAVIAAHEARKGN